MKVTLALAACVVVGGCSIIYNQNNIGKPIDAAPDSPPDAAPDAPADPTMLAVDGAFPSAVFAGQGSGDSRPALLAIHGSNFTSDATVTFDNPQLHVVSTQVAGDASWIAVQLEIDAIAGSGSSGSDGSGSGSDGSGSNGCGSAFVGIPVAITITETGASPAMLTCALALQEAPALTGSATVDVSDLENTIYSVVDLSKVTITDTHATNHPIVFQAYSSITLPEIDAFGGSGAGSSGGSAGQGGCAGGGGTQTGGCSSAQGGGNGAGASTSNGGGGGGFVVAGGTGTTGVSGGPMHGSDDLVTLSGNQSAGGGGGNAALSLGSGGGGGGGGGTVVVLAGGKITIPRVNVSGGAGANGPPTLSAGGGGGGTGGVIVLRSVASIVEVSDALLSDGGAAGAAGGLTGGGAGGAGVAGRVRVDMQTGTLPTVANSVSGATPPSFHRGPVFATSTPAIATSLPVHVTLLGQDNDSIALYYVDQTGTAQDGPSATFGPVGTASLDLMLSPGFNHVCTTVNGRTATAPITDPCVDIIYLP